PRPPPRPRDRPPVTPAERGHRSRTVRERRASAAATAVVRLSHRSPLRPSERTRHWVHLTHRKPLSGTSPRPPEAALTGDAQVPHRDGTGSGRSVGIVTTTV